MNLGRAPGGQAGERSQKKGGCRQRAASGHCGAQEGRGPQKAQRAEVLRHRGIGQKRHESGQGRRGERGDEVDSGDGKTCGAGEVRGAGRACGAGGGLALRTAFAAIEQFERARGDEGEKGRRYGCRGSGSEQKEGEPQPEENDLVNDSVHGAIMRFHASWVKG